MCWRSFTSSRWWDTRVVALLLVLHGLTARAGAENTPPAPPPLTPQTTKTIPEPVLDRSTPLYEQAPFDLLYLNPANNNAVLKLSPVQLPERKVPQPLPKSGYLEIELFDRPGERYRVPWQAVVQLKLFEQILLEEAARLIQENNFESAFDYLEYVTTHYPNTPGLLEAQQALLEAEARHALQREDYERAFADLCRLFELNPKHPELEALLGQAVDGLVIQRLKEERYVAARGVVETLAGMLPQYPVAEKWRKQWQQEASEIQKEAERALDEGRGRDADRLVRKLEKIWPQQPGLDALLRRVRTIYPRVQIGVTQFSDQENPLSRLDWAGRRSGRLIRLPLVEYSGPGPEGGHYRSAFVEWQIEPQKRLLTLKIRSDCPAFEGNRRLSAYDLAQLLANRADRYHPTYCAPWAEALQTIRVISPQEVTITFRRMPLKPEALLSCIPVPAGVLVASGTWSAGAGLFSLSRTESSARVRVYLRRNWPLNPSPQATNSGPAQIDEILFPRGRDALRALQQGDVEVVDRINPWEVFLIEGSKTIRVQAYRAPLVHFLVPNFRKPLPANRDFRRALLYALNKEQILRSLLGGREIPGCRVISGVFLHGTTLTDPLGYGTDPQITPRDYQPSLALALAEIAFRQATEIAKKRGLPAPKRAEIVLAHPADEVALQACRQIQSQWKQIGWNTRLVEYRPDAAPPEDYDFLYVEAALWEPIVDSHWVFGELIPVTEFLSPQVQLMVATLGQAADWPDLGGRLRNLHRWVYEDCTVLPLWQLIEYYAFRTSLRGLEEPRVSLYQDVETWQVGP